MRCSWRSSSWRSSSWCLYFTVVNIRALFIFPIFTTLDYFFFTFTLLRCLLRHAPQLALEFVALEFVALEFVALLAVFLCIHTYICTYIAAGVEFVALLAVFLYTHTYLHTYISQLELEFVALLA
jgi:hypothetical protein